MPLQQPTPEKLEAPPTPEPLPNEIHKPLAPGAKYTMQTPIEEIRQALIQDGIRLQQGNEVSDIITFKTHFYAAICAQKC